MSYQPKMDAAPAQVDIKPGQVWAWQDTDFARGPHGFQFEIAAAAPHAPDVAYRYPDAAGLNPDQIYAAPAAVIRAHAVLVADIAAPPAPLDPSKVKAGDTVTVIVQPDEDRPESTTTGEVWADYRDNPHGPILRVGTVYLGGPMVTLTAHQPAPEPEPEWKPGTTGWATVSDSDDLFNLRVMRVEWDGIFGFATESGRIIADEAAQWSVSDFVPDEPRPLPTREQVAEAIMATDKTTGNYGLYPDVATKAADAVLALLRGESR